MFPSLKTCKKLKQKADRIFLLCALKAERKESTAPTGNLMNRLKILKFQRTEIPENRTEKIAFGRTRTT